MDFNLSVSNDVYGKVKMNSKSKYIMSNDKGLVSNTFTNDSNHITQKLHKHSNENYDIEIVHGNTSVLFATVKKASDITIYIQGKDDLDIHTFSKVMVTYKGNYIYELKASLDVGRKVHIMYSNTQFILLDAIIQGGVDTSFRINYRINGKHDSEDKSIVEDVVKRWARIITGPLFPNDNCELSFTIAFKDFAPNILGNATPTNFRKYQNHYIPCEGNINLNKNTWTEQKKQIKKDGKSSAYYTLLHEFGHILGIGTYWRSPDDNEPRPHLIDVGHKEIIDDFPVYTRYIGQHALAKYREAIKNDNVTFIPIEDDGGSGTAGGHIEEGIDTAHGTKYHDGHSHPGLDRELMTGISEIDDEPEILSSITVGFLHDMGFSVNYDESDDGLYPLWADKNNIVGGYLNPGETIQADIYVHGKVFYKYLENTYSGNIKNILLNLNYGSSIKKIVLRVKGDVILYSYEKNYENGVSENIEKIDGNHEIKINHSTPLTINCEGEELSSINFKLKGSVLC